MNDIQAANEHIEDIRRAADKHNTIARMKAAGQDEHSDNRQGKKINGQRKLWERVRKALR